MTDFDLDWIISVDDHVIEPPHVWQEYVPAKFRDHAPRMTVEDGVELWHWDGKVYPTSGMNAAAGRDREEFSPLPLTYEEMRPGCYDPKARVEDMDRDHVLASMPFPTFPRFAGPLFSECADRDLGLACIRAYNDWMIDEWCGTAPGRFIPLVIVPLWDGRLAAAEVERCAAKGEWGSRWRRIRIYRGLRKWCRSSCRRGAMPTNRHRQTRRKRWRCTCCDHHELPPSRWMAFG